MRFLMYLFRFASIAKFDEKFKISHMRGRVRKLSFSSREHTKICVRVRGRAKNLTLPHIQISWKIANH